MRPSNDDENAAHSKQRDLLDYWTFGIAVGGVVLLFIYTTINYCLLRTTQDSFEVSNRPIIAVTAYHARESDWAHPKQPFANVWIGNYGHLPAKVRVRKATIFSHDPVASGPDPTHEAEETLTVPPGGGMGNRIDYEPPAPEKEAGWYYLAGIVDYETPAHHYQTRFCFEFPWPDTLPEMEARLCADRSTNYID
jgi:hypothetical protein